MVEKLIAVKAAVNATSTVTTTSAWHCAMSSQSFPIGAVRVLRYGHGGSGYSPCLLACSLNTFYLRSLVSYLILAMRRR